MNTSHMQMIGIDRADLARLLTGQSFSPLLSSHQGDIVIASPIPDKRIIVPQALFINGMSVAEFLAWANTYVSLQQPLSASMHVLPHDMLPWYHARLELEHGDVLPIAGAIVARQLFSGDTSPSPLSYSMGVAAALELEPSWCERILAGWRLAHTIVAGSIDVSEREVADEVDGFWRIVIGRGLRGDRDEALKASLDQLLEHRNLTSSQVVHLLGTSIDISRLERTRMSRDEKLPIVNEFIDRLRNVDASATRRAFLAGYAMSRLALGSVEYAALLARLDVPVSAALWYGYISLLSAEPAPGPTIVALQGIAQRLTRARDVKAFPSCHSSIEELEVLSRIQSALASVSPHETVRIELAPFVTAWFPQREADRAGSSESFTELNRLLRRSVEIVEGMGGNKSPNKKRR